MKKLSEDHYIICDDSEIKEGDWIGFPNLKKFVPVQYFGGDLTGGEKKITYSTQPESLGMGWMQSVLPLLLSEVKELIGVVDVEKKAWKYNPVKKLDAEFIRAAYICGYNEALEDKKEQKYTRNEVHSLMCKAFEQGLKKADVLEAGLEGKETDVECAWILTRHDSTPKKTEWEVEFVDGKLKLK